MVSESTVSYIEHGVQIDLVFNGSPLNDCAGTVKVVYYHTGESFDVPEITAGVEVEGEFDDFTDQIAMLMQAQFWLRENKETVQAALEAFAAA